MRGSKLMRTDLFFPVDFSRRPKESKVIKIAHMGMITGFVQIAIVSAAAIYTYEHFQRAAVTTPPIQQKKHECKPAVGAAKPAPAKPAAGQQGNMTEFEQRIAQSITAAKDLKIGFSDIAGIDDVLQELHENILDPFIRPLVLTPHRLYVAPKGLLLSGPHRCGKTMVAKALAKESGATFFNIAFSDLAAAFFGEPNNLIKALFSLARKMQPSVIFLDEAEGFLQKRETIQNSYVVHMQTEFLSLWDGLLSDGLRILVVVATYRPQDIDAAFMRRMPHHIKLTLPDLSARRQILKAILEGVTLDKDISIDEIADWTAGYTPAELNDTCRAAANTPCKEFRKANPVSPCKCGQAIATSTVVKLRSLRCDDFKFRSRSQRTST